MSWKDDIVMALRNLGGSASLSDIYAEVHKIRPHALTPKWQATVRNQIESWSSDSRNWKPGRDDEFRSVGGKGSGVWALREAFLHDGWWEHSSAERFWMEITERGDLGADLNAPQRNDKGDEYWSYSFVRRMRPGDIVFHYHRSPAVTGVVGASIAVGEAWEDEVVWGVKGGSARKAKVQPYPRRGWRRALEQYTPLEPPLTLATLRRHEEKLRGIRDELQALYPGKPLYFPFDFSKSRPMRTAQGYLVKFPSSVVAAVPELSQFAHRLSLSPTESQAAAGAEVRTGEDAAFGSPYRHADEDTAVSLVDPMSRDPAQVERGNRGHRKTQNTLAQQLHKWGMAPLSPNPSDPNFDIAWERDGAKFVCEVKSTTPTNETKQLRLGLGQVLHYRATLRQGGSETVAVLAVENPVADPLWEALCGDLGVILAWPGVFEQRLPH